MFARVFFGFSSVFNFYSAIRFSAARVRKHLFFPGLGDVKDRKLFFGFLLALISLHAHALLTWGEGRNWNYEDCSGKSTAQEALQCWYRGWVSSYKDYCPAFGMVVISNSEVRSNFTSCLGTPPNSYVETGFYAHAHGSCDNGQVFSAQTLSCICPSGKQWNIISSSCIAGSKNFGNQCSAMVGNPINAGFGNKFQLEKDYVSTQGNLALNRSYNSMAKPVAANSGSIVAQHWGSNWLGVYDRTLIFSDYLGSMVSVVRPDGRLLDFSNSGSGWVANDLDVNDKLTVLAGGGWQYYESSTDTTETYNKSAQLLSIKARNGFTQTLTYSDGSSGANGGYVVDGSGVATTTILPSGLLLRVVDNFGRVLRFGYDASGRTIEMVSPEGGVYLYSYDAVGNLSSVTYPDLSTRTYIYNESSNTSGANIPSALTGIIDENAQRFATYKYDSSGRAISSEHAGSVEKSSIVYSTDTNGNVVSSSVTDPLSTSRTYSFANVLGVVKNTGISQPCAACGGAAANALTYDPNGNVSSRTDFNGNVTNYAYDLTRNLETSRTEAYGTPKARTITTQWHATYRLPTLITEPGKTTAFGYDTSGNLLTKTITDTALNTSRTWTWTYNSLGQVLTADGPRTDVSDVTTYTYYTAASSVSGNVHSIGDLATVTNAVGHVTTITNYDLNGRPLSITDPNGIVTTLTYWPRGWLKTRTVNGVQITSYDYDGVGQLTKVTLPDGSYLAYTYDAAHRLTDITDKAGNSIHYTLDAMGNRTQEDTKDPSNAIKKTRSRVYDGLNRLYQAIGGTNPSTQITQYGYDNNGNLKTVTDPLSHVTTNNYDALNRLISIVDANTPTGTTQNTYNALDQLTQVQDPRLVTTAYTVDALGNVSLTQSPDSGNTAAVYDAAGNLTQKTDARGIVTNYTYDAINRLTHISYPASPTENVDFVYDYDGFFDYPEGHLSYINDADGYVVVGAYDAYGNVMETANWLSTASTGANYTYDTANRVASITYPSGRIVDYTRNVLGQITQVQLRENDTASPQTLVSGVTYKPFGPLAGLTFGNGVATTLTYDADYRVTRITATSTPNWDYTYGYDAEDNITSLTDQVSTNDRTYTYDALHRLTLDNKTTLGTLGTNEYQYDAGGNRTLFKQGLTLSYPQTYASTSNRETQYATQAMTQDAAGNLTGYGTKIFAYDSAGRMSLASIGTTNTTYRYNGLGQRTTKLVTVGTTTTTTHYDYDRDGKYLGQIQLNADGTYAQGDEYLWLDDTPIAQMHTVYGVNNAITSEQLLYIHADHLNTPRAMTDATKKVVWKWETEAYGRTAPNADPDGDGIQTKLDLRFPGQIADAETGFYYNLNRYYDPIAGRYTQSDPIGLGGGLNTYAYVRGSPLKYIDSTGLCLEDACVVEGAIAATLGQAVVDAIGIYTGMSSTPHSRDEYDDQNIERIANQREYQNNCDNQTPPPGLDSCEAAKWKLEHAKMCLDSRRAYTDKWHNGVDDKHDPQLYRDLDRRIQAAEKEVERECSCQK